MNHRPSPWLGGPGARWAQGLLFLLHLALVIALVLCIRTFWLVLPRIDAPGWQRASILAGLVAALTVFGLRGLRIGVDLWGAFQAHRRTSRSRR